MRLVAAHSFLILFDGGWTLLGVHAVAERGWSQRTSGALYLHGTTSPTSWLRSSGSAGGLDDLFILRAVNAILGAITVYLTYRLAPAVVETTAPALLGRRSWPSTR
jgi:hypothetical protein